MLTGDLQARDVVLVRELESESFGVVADLFDLVQFQADEALISASESRRCTTDFTRNCLGFVFRGRSRLSGLVTWSAHVHVVICTDAGRGGEGGVENCIGALRLTFCGISTSCLPGMEWSDWLQDLRSCLVLRMDE